MKITKYCGIIAAVALALSTNAYAADIDTTFATTESNDARDFYVGVSIAPEVFVFNLEDGGLDAAIANTFVGIGGTAQVCKRGIGSLDFIDLCAGGHVFQSLTSGAEEAVVLGVPLESETDIFTYGAFAQAKLNAGAFFVGPYGGVRRVEAEFSGDLSGTLAVSESEDTAVFGGAEIGFNLFNRHVELGLSGEGGTSVSDNEFTYFKGNAFIRAKF